MSVGELERPYLAGRGAAGGAGEVVERLLQEGEQQLLVAVQLHPGGAVARPRPAQPASPARHSCDKPVVGPVKPAAGLGVQPGPGAVGPAVARVRLTPRPRPVQPHHLLPAVSQVSLAAHLCLNPCLVPDRDLHSYCTVHRDPGEEELGCQLGVGPEVHRSALPGQVLHVGPGPKLSRGKQSVVSAGRGTPHHNY